MAVSSRDLEGPPSGSPSGAAPAGTGPGGSAGATAPVARPVEPGQLPASSARAASSPDVSGQAGDLWQMVVAYAKQETIVPIKALGRYVAFGLAGSVALSIGLVLLVLGLLRLLQSATGDALDGNLSFVPYLVALLLAAAAAFLALRAIGGAKRERQQRGR